MTNPMFSPDPIYKHRAVKDQSPTAPRFSVLVALIVLCGMILTLWRKIEISEVFFHLKAGQVITKNQQLPNRDIFSATSSVGMWVYFEWLWGMVLALAWQAGEWVGVNLLTIALAIVFCLLSIVRCRRYGGQWFESIIVLTLALVALIPVFQPTPAMAALPVFLLSLLLMEASRKRWPMILMPAVASIWANINIAAPLLLVVPLARAIYPDVPTQAVREPIRRKFFLMVAVACLIGFLIVPHSVQIYTAWFRAAWLHIESFGPNFIQAVLDPAFIMPFTLAIVYFSLSLWQRTMSKWQILASSFMLLLTLTLFRDVVYFTLVFLTAPAARSLSQAMRGTWRQGTNLRVTAAIGLIVACCAWASIVIASNDLRPDAWGISSAGKMTSSGVVAGRFPEMPAGRLAAIPLRAAVLNTPEDSDYLIWRLWPGWKTTIDNRPGFYDATFLNQYDGVWRGEPGWQAMLSLWRVQAVLGNRSIIERFPNQSLYTALADSDDWQPVYWDATHIMYLKSNIELTNSNLAAFRQLKPGITWDTMKRRISTPLEWQELAADLRRALLDDPMNEDAQEFLRRTESEAGKL